MCSTPPAMATSMAPNAIELAVVVTAVIGLFLPEVPLSRKTGMEQVAEAESAETAETAEAESAGSAEAEAESVSSQ